VIIELEDVHKTYYGADGPPLLVLDGVSLTVKEGEFLCIVGPSGCGKSTLVNLLSGLDSPDQGQIAYRGTRTATGPLTTVVWQDYALIPWRSVLDNVAFGLEVRGVGKRERQAAARHHLARMGISGFEAHYPHQLSGGMRQRVGIARALTNDPEALLMDEPFAAVDAQTRLILQAELIDLWLRDRKTVVFITHNIEEAVLLGDRVVVLGHRPTRVVEEIDVPFTRPRGVEVERDPRFVDARVRIWELLKPRTAAAEQEATLAGSGA
jgi:NitT/TauT family transport system ATP-binding protein